MLDKKQVQEALGRIDQALVKVNGDRIVHIGLVNDIRMIQTICMERFEAGEPDKDPNEDPKEPEVDDGGTDKPTVDATTGNKDS